MKKVWISLIVVVVIVAVWLMTGGKKEVNNSVTTPQAQNVITYTDSGYSPSSITIKKGQAVVWKNESSKKMWTASALHPTHSVYPTTGGCLGSTFDACMGIPSGGNWSFKFDNVGTDRKSVV